MSVSKIYSPGDIVGRLTLVRSFMGSTRRRRLWACRCSCGKFVKIRESSLVVGNTKSCGCLRNELTSVRWTTHGMTGSSIRNIWNAMMQRCYNSKCKNYIRYGARGVVVCERWHVFENFYVDVGDRPEGLSLDRFPDNNGDYEPGNVRWATRKQQARNKRTNRIVTISGIDMSLAEATDIQSLKYATVQSRLRRGWSLDRALGM